MCLFTSGKDIPPLVRISLRTLQHLVIPLFSLVLLLVGALHLGQCPAQPLLPIWHVVAGTSGLLTPFLYLLFDEINPRMSRRFPGVSEVLDNIVVFLLPLYIVFEVVWLITGTVWTYGSQGVDRPDQCAHTLYVFSAVVVANFWVHLTTPLLFMLTLCCTRLFPYCGYCAYWNVFKTALDNWTRRTRLALCVGVAVPLGASMVVTGGLSLSTCRPAVDGRSNGSDDRVLVDDDVSGGLNETSTPAAIESPSPPSLIPLWLLVAGVAVLFVPLIYYIYDKCCKAEEGGPLIKRVATCTVIGYLTLGLTWSLVGFLWVFGAHNDEHCGQDSFTYQFAFFTLITMNAIMDLWICFKICVVLHWAFLSDD